LTRGGTVRGSSRDGLFSYCRYCNRSYHKARNKRIGEKKAEEKMNKHYSYDFDPLAR
jgi:hypothetical protein